ncbi:MAG: CoA-binding protein [Candidatus Neomarinimicrobiota bacterium]
MSSDNQNFWKAKSYALLGYQAERNFPLLTLAGLLRNGKTVYPVDPTQATIDSRPAFKAIADLPEPVEAAVIELPRERTAAAVREAVAAGIRNIWLHQRTETAEALEIAREAGVNLVQGTCAVMYVNTSGMHKFHCWIMKLLKKF